MKLTAISSFLACYIHFLLSYSAIPLARAASIPSLSDSDTQEGKLGNNSSQTPLNLSEIHLHSDKSVLEVDSKGSQESAVVKIIIPNFIVCDPGQLGVCKDDLLEVCRPVSGMFRCLCPENISRTSHGKCTVFNECFEKSANNCSNNADCVDLEEGYTCRCKEGFKDHSPNPSLPGRQCTGDPSESVPPIPEVTTSPHVIGENRDEKHSVNLEAHALAAASLLAFQSQSKDDESKSSTPPSQSDPSNDDESKSAIQSAIIDTQPRAPSMNENTLREVFRSFDLDRNERIAFWELKSAVDLYQVNIEDKDIQKMIKVADASGDGFVDFVEFASVLTPIRR